MSYAAAGLARGLQGGLGLVSNALLGIQQRHDQERELALREEQLRIDAEQRQSDAAARDAELGITRGRTPTQVRFGDTTIGAGGTSGTPLSVPSNVMATAKLRGPGGPPAPSVTEGFGLGMEPTRRLKGLQVPGREAIETPFVPSVDFGENWAEVDPTKGLAYQRQVAALDLKDRQDAEQRAREQAEENAARDAIIAQLPEEMRANAGALDTNHLQSLLGELSRADEYRRRGWTPQGNNVIAPRTTQTTDRGIDAQARLQAVDLMTKNRRPDGTFDRAGVLDDADRIGGDLGLAVKDQALRLLADRAAADLRTTPDEPTISLDSLTSLGVRQPQPGGPKEQGFTGMLHRLMPGGQSGYIEPDTTPRLQGPMPRDTASRRLRGGAPRPDSLGDARALVAPLRGTMGDGQLRAILEEQGYQPDEINSILAGG